MNTLSQVAREWLASKKTQVKPSSYALYAHLCLRHVVPQLGPAIPDEAALRDLVQRLLAAGYAPKTVKDILLVAKMIHRYGEKYHGWPHETPTIRIPQAHPNISTLTTAQQRRLHQYLMSHPGPRNLGILLCLHSGLRIGEACGLQWKDIDLDNGVIRVTKTVQRIYLRDGTSHAYYLSVDSPKTESSVREIPLPSALKGLFRFLKKGSAASDFLLSESSRPLEPRCLRAHYYRQLEHAGIPPVRFHALRHSFATRCIEAGCDCKTVSAILGHSTIATTLNLYVHPGYRDKKRVIEKMAKELG